MSGTLPIDVQIEGIRIARRTGTTQRRQRDVYIRMCHQLGDWGRVDILKALRDGGLSFAEVYSKYRLGDASKLPEPELFRSLQEAWRVWLTAKRRLGARTRRDYERALDRLTAIQPSASVTDLPALLQRHAAASAGVRPTAFNQDKRAALSFLASLVGHFHPLYGAVHRLEALEVEAEAINPQTPDQIRALAAWLQQHVPTHRGPRASYAHHARTLWGLCLTGMRPEEFWEETVGRRRASWSLLEDRVQVNGIKTKSSVRPVPRVALLTKPGSKIAFRRALGKACQATGMAHVTLYDCRRTFANWMVAAGIPANRRDVYRAHGAGNMRELYERPGELRRALLEDAEALAGYVGLIALEQGLRVVK